MGNGLKEQRVPSSLGAVREQGNSMIGCLVSVTVSLLCIVLRQNYEVALLFGFWVLGFFFPFYHGLRAALSEVGAVWSHVLLRNTMNWGCTSGELVSIPRSSWKL